MVKNNRWSNAFIFRLSQASWIHILVWSLMLTYLAIAPSIYTRFILEDGKPVPFNGKITHKTSQAAYLVDRFDPVVLRGQNIYLIRGWAFLLKDPDTSAFERLIVLRSDENTYYFSSVPMSRPDIQDQFPEIKLPADTGFSAYVSKDMLPRGTYRIGILFQHRDNNAVYYLPTDLRIIRTPNSLQLLAP